MRRHVSGIIIRVSGVQVPPPLPIFSRDYGLWRLPSGAILCGFLCVWPDFGSLAGIHGYTVKKLFRRWVRATSPRMPLRC